MQLIGWCTPWLLLCVSMSECVCWCVLVCVCWLCECVRGVVCVWCWCVCWLCGVGVCGVGVCVGCVVLVVWCWLCGVCVSVCVDECVLVVWCVCIGVCVLMSVCWCVCVGVWVLIQWNRNHPQIACGLSPCSWWTDRQTDMHVSVVRKLWPALWIGVELLNPWVD